MSHGTASHGTHSIALAVGPDQVLERIVRPRRKAVGQDPRFAPGELLDRTVEYVRTVLRAGVYVLARDNEIVLFVPFAYPEFQNTWGDQLTREDGCPTPPGLEDPRKWWANAGILCTVPQPGFWGTAFLNAYRSMIRATLAACPRGACYEFVLNKRDHPCVRRDGKHPWTHVWRGGEVPRAVSGTMLPFLSPYTGDAYADACIPLACPDWCLATQSTHGEQSARLPTIPVRVPWAEKRRAALFRGSDTGDGTRLRLCAEFDGQTIGGLALDFGITRASRRFRVDAGVVRPPRSDLPAPTGYVPMHLQGRWKVLIVVDGHSAPNRVGTLLLTGSLIVRVESRAAGSTVWLDRFLRPMKHYIPVAHDLSDLTSRLKWIGSHPRECEAIAGTCLRLGQKLLRRDSMLRATWDAMEAGRRTGEEHK